MAKFQNSKIHRKSIKLNFVKTINNFCERPPKEHICQVWSISMNKCRRSSEKMLSLTLHGANFPLTLHWKFFFFFFKSKIPKIKNPFDVFYEGPSKVVGKKNSNWSDRKCKRSSVLKCSKIPHWMVWMGKI